MLVIALKRLLYSEFKFKDIQRIVRNHTVWGVPVNICLLAVQSAVCMKQLAYNLLELLIQAAFPELHDVISICHTHKERFGDIEED